MKFDEIAGNMDGLLPLSLRVWLASDDYEYSNDPTVISATSLLRPLKAIVLSRRASGSAQPSLDALIPSRLGSAIHDSIKRAWQHDKLYKVLGTVTTPEEASREIIVNPSKDIACDNMLAIHTEERYTKALEGFVITGQFDFVYDGILEDFKSTGVYNYISGSNDYKYIQQASIYRWLAPWIITKDYFYIRFIFTDWSKIRALQEISYPNSRITSKKFMLLSLEETEDLIRSILQSIKQYENSDEADIPPCSAEDLWQKAATWKYYKDPSKQSRATKNFDTQQEAEARYYSDGQIGKILHVPGEVVRCKFCNAVNICQQAAGYINEGLLTL